MKKFWKIFLIAFSSLLAFVLIVICLACYFVFTPERLTPIVSTQLNKELTCDVEIAEVDLTFFSTFPRFSLCISDAVFSDTTYVEPLLSTQKLYAAIDISELLFGGSIVVEGVKFKNGSINVFVDSLGNANYDIFPPSAEEEEVETDEPFELPFENINLSNVKFDNISVFYEDKSSALTAIVDSLFCSFDGNISEENLNFKTTLSLEDVSVQMTDSSELATCMQDISLNATVSMFEDKITTNMTAGLFVDSLCSAGDKMLTDATIQLDCPIEIDMTKQAIELNNTKMQLNALLLDFTGQVAQKANDALAMNVDVSSNNWDFDSLFALIPPSYTSMLEDFKQLQGSLTFKGKVAGLYTDSLMPTVQSDFDLQDVTIEYVDVPSVITNLNSSMSAFVDLNDEGMPSTLDVKTFSGNIGQNRFSASGKVNDLLEDITCSLLFNADFDFSMLRPYIPEDLPMELAGRTKASLRTHFRLDDMLEGKIERVNAHAKFDYADLNVVYDDSIHLSDSKGTLTFQLPSGREKKVPNELIEASLRATDLQFSMIDFMQAQVKMPSMKIALSNPLDTTRMPSAECEFSAQNLSVLQDSMSVNAALPEGKIALHVSEKEGKLPMIKMDYSSELMDVVMTDVVTANTKQISLSATSYYDETQEKQILKWNPFVSVDFNEGKIDLADSDSKIEIPVIRFNLTPEEMNIADGRIILDDSDFSLSGKISNISKFINNEDLLLGELNYHSAITNVDQIMDFVDGFGSETTSDTVVVATEMTTDTLESKPFMVPKGVDIALNTHIERAIFNAEPIDNIRGKLTVNDGKLVLEQMGFTSNAAEMLLTAVYRSDRENHLYAGFDFHLLDINIEHLIDMIPMIDSVMPMLTSFEGKGEFHFAGETYLTSNYDPKISTLRAAAAIEGKDLVLLDSETFDEISKMLLFKKSSKNVIDSLSVEATVYKDEVDLYPFLISMDKWQAVISGRHNMDNNFNYHVSLTDCPLPVRLGLDVKGNFDDMKYNLVPCKHKALYKPEKQGVAEKRVLEMKRIISDSLKQNVKKEK